jgi:hypothetical protein
MLTGFGHLHSANRYILLALILIVIFTSFSKWRGKQSYSAQDDKLNLITFILTHIQLLLGFILYFAKGWYQFTPSTMKVPALRFFSVEHMVGMLIAIALITLARIKGKKVAEAAKRHKLTFWYYVIALILIFASIPWPFRGFGNEWF